MVQLQTNVGKRISQLELINLGLVDEMKEDLQADISALKIAELFLVEVVGGLALGLLFGWITFRLLKTIDDYATEVILTLALVMGGTLLAQELHVLVKSLTMLHLLTF